MYGNLVCAMVCNTIFQMRTSQFNALDRFMKFKKNVVDLSVFELLRRMAFSTESSGSPADAFECFEFLF